MRCLTAGLTIVLIVTSAAFAQNSMLSSDLLHGPGRENGLVVWEFDPESGATLGNGIDLRCMKANLIFKADGTLAYENSFQVPPVCPATIRPGMKPPRWELTFSQDTGAVRLNINDDDGNCEFALNISTNQLLLATVCRQVAGQPRQFRYFPRLLDE
jgi:hypothetical protein